MQLNKSILIATLLAAASLAAVSNAHAAAATGSFDVKLTIKETCSVQASKGTQDIEFGTHIAGSTALTSKSKADIKINCSNKTPYNIGLLGTGFMTDSVSTDKVSYKLLKTEGGDVWGNKTTGEVGGTGTGMASTKTKTHTVFAAIDGLTDDLTPGSYIDTVNVTVTY